MNVLILLAAAYVLFHATHGFVDYWVQRPWQAENKSKRGLLPFSFVETEVGDSGQIHVRPKLKWIGWNTAVLSHSIEYTLGFLPALWFLHQYSNFSIPLVMLSIWLPHTWMDTRKFLNAFVYKTKGWLPPSELKDLASEQDMINAAVKVHVTIEMDQTFHYLSLLGSAFLVAYGIGL